MIDVLVPPPVPIVTVAALLVELPRELVTRKLYWTPLSAVVSARVV